MLSERRMPLEEKIRFIEKAIKEGKDIEIEYLKPNDRKTVRRVTPEEVVRDAYRGVEFMALKGYCNLRRQKRTFRVDRIIRIISLIFRTGRLIVKISKGVYSPITFFRLGRIKRQTVSSNLLC